MMEYLLVFLGGGAGCVFRYAVSNAVSRIYTGSFPVATLTSNVISCTVLVALVSFLAANFSDEKWIRPALIVGFCGGLSTFSTFSFETAWLIKNGSPWVAVANMVISISVCLWILYRWVR